MYGVARSAATLDLIRAAGAVPMAAGAPRRRLQDLAAWVIHSAPPPSDARRSGGGHEDLLTRAWSARLLQRRPSAAVPPATASPAIATSPAFARTSGGALRRVVYLSTTGVYGNRQGRWTDETTAPQPVTDRARRRVDAERRLRHAARGVMRLTTLRVPGIYAADRLPLERLHNRVPALSVKDDVQTNHIHADDLARLARAALLRWARPRTINVVDDSVLPMGDYLDMVARWAGLPPPPRLDRETLLATVTPMRASFMNESRLLSNRRMKRELKLRLRYPTIADFLARQVPPAHAKARPTAPVQGPPRREASAKTAAPPPI